MDLIDLHTHTTASDGSLTPPELVDLAHEIGLKAVAVTDHDTLAGLEPALNRAHDLGFELVPGVEISADFTSGSMHILGYLIDHKNPNLASKLATLQEARLTRNPKIAARLNKLGLAISMSEVEAVAGGGQVGRPHFAKVMLDKGYVSNFKEAFDRFLAKGAPAYVNKFRLGPAEALALIREAGGLSVLAHPYTLKLDNLADLEDLLADLKRSGLAGLETYYSEHTPQMTKDYLALAQKLDLQSTGGSDFHGTNKKHIKLGCGRGGLAVPYDLLTGLRQRKELL
ncbi:MAG: PHP domain-containing protein [Thermodesulfobacteriota bacterium]|nr:PHP domain-containing protein [Thermodesulfobacteriota bacterium]